LLLPGGAAWAWNQLRPLLPGRNQHAKHLPSATGIDGNIIGDPANSILPDNGWTSAWRYSFNNGSFVHDGVVQGIKDNDYLYLSFEVNHDENLIDTDAIVIAFDPIDPTVDPTGSAAERRLLHIVPLIPDGVASPVGMTYWQGYPWSVRRGTACGTEAVASASGSNPDRSWFVDLSSRAAFGIPAADFGMCFNISDEDRSRSCRREWVFPGHCPNIRGPCPGHLS
jgi:hypothetical protein